MSHRISLCICTMNRPVDLGKCLESVEASRARPHEVLVSDDSRDEAMQASNREVVSRHPRATYLPGPKRGLSANRNNCLRSASGDLIVFVDDDVILDPEFFGKGAEEYDRLRRLHGLDRIIVTGDEIRPEGRGGPSDLSFLGYYTQKTSEAGAPGAFCINSTLFPAGLFREALFDENILFGTEERDMSLQARHLGYRILYSPHLANFHYPSPINRSVYNRAVMISRVYFGLKRYWLYEKSAAKFVAFNAVVLIRAVGSRLKALRFRECVHEAGAFVEAWRLFRARLRPIEPSR